MLTVSNSLRPHGLQPNKLQCPGDFSGKNTGVGGYFLLQGISPTQGSNLGLLHWQTDSLPSESPSQISYSVPLHISCTFPSHHEAPLSFLTDPLPSSHAIPPGILVFYWDNGNSLLTCPFACKPRIHHLPFLELPLKTVTHIAPGFA